MPNILFASNNIGHWPTAVAGSVVGTFDPTRVPYAIALSNYEVLNSPQFTPASGTSSSTWFHFRLYASTQNFGRSDVLLQAYDPTGRLLFRISKRANSSGYFMTSLLYDGATTVTGAPTIGLTEAKVNQIDVEYAVSPLSLILRVYVNGSLAGTTSFGANPNAYVAPNRFSIGTGWTDNLTDRSYISEILVANGDTRNARLNLLRPNAAGAFEQWLGSLGSLADDDMTTGMTTTVAGARQTVTLTPYTGATNISNIVAVSSTTRGLNSPTGLRHTVRLSTINYDSPLIPIGSPLQYNLTDWQINPATSLPWVSSDLSLIETGFISVA